MSNLIKVTHKNREFLIESDDLAELTKDGVRGSTDSMEKIITSFDSISDTINSFCLALLESFDDLSERAMPDKILTEFGIKLNAEGNVYVVKSAGEASLKVSLEWNRP